MGVDPSPYWGAPHFEALVNKDSGVKLKTKQYHPIDRFIDRLVLPMYCDEPAKPCGCIPEAATMTTARWAAARLPARERVSASSPSTSLNTSPLLLAPTGK
jgi:hypothetical protein